jgi:hypothetical protein
LHRLARLACRTREITHASDNNKRIVPIVRIDVETARVPENLAKFNWLFCREADDFHTAFQSLIKAIDSRITFFHW